jgi:hypothetical protein
MSLAAITSLRRNLSEWANRAANRQFMQRDQETQLRTSLPDPRRRPQVHVASWMLGTWHLGHGFAQVLDGNGSGFDEARIGQSLRRCSLLLREQHQPVARGAGRRLPFSLLQASVTVLLGLALDDPEAALYDVFRQLPDAAFGDDDHLPFFTRELLAVREGRRPKVTARLGPYEGVLRHWDGEERLFAQQLAAMLDLHLQGVRSAKAPFDDPACQLHPFEALAVRGVRSWLSLRTPKIDHPLMFTNLGTMSPSGPWPENPTARQLERNLRRR